MYRADSIYQEMAYKLWVSREILLFLFTSLLCYFWELKFVLGRWYDEHDYILFYSIVSLDSPQNKRYVELFYSTEVKRTRF